MSKIGSKAGSQISKAVRILGPLPYTPILWAPLAPQYQPAFHNPRSVTSCYPLTSMVSVGDPLAWALPNNIQPKAETDAQLKWRRCYGCSNMTRQMPLWYVREQNLFETMTRDHPRIEVVRVPGGSVQFDCCSDIYSAAGSSLLIDVYSFRFYYGRPME